MKITFHPDGSPVIPKRFRALPPPPRADGRDDHFLDYPLPPTYHDDYRLTDEKLLGHIWAKGRAERGLGIEVLRCWKKIMALEAQLYGPLEKP